jgi:hypothetical protein
MEKKELGERLSDLKLLKGVYRFKFDDLIDFILDELDKAREEGIKEGAKEMFEELELFPIPKDYLKVFLSNLKNNK